MTGPHMTEDDMEKLVLRSEEAAVRAQVSLWWTKFWVCVAGVALLVNIALLIAAW